MVCFIKIEILENLPVMKASDRLWSLNGLRYLAEALRTLERKLQNIKQASMTKIKFHSDQNKMSMQKKENSVPWYNNEYKEAKKLMRKARRQFIYALNSLTHQLREFPSVG